MRGVFELSDPRGQRLELAIGLLHDRGCFMFAGVLFRRGDHGEVVCEAVTQWQESASQTAAAHEDLARARAASEQLRTESPKYASLVQAATVRYAVIEDMDVSTFEVCREVQGQIVWPGHGRHAG
jgi:hypothetical protein